MTISCHCAPPIMSVPLSKTYTYLHVNQQFIVQCKIVNSIISEYRGILNPHKKTGRFLKSQMSKEFNPKQNDNSNYFS